MYTCTQPPDVAVKREGGGRGSSSFPELQPGASHRYNVVHLPFLGGLDGVTVGYEHLVEDV